MKSHQTDFSTGNIYRNICEVSIPMIFAQLLNLLYNVVDRIYIGRIPDTGTISLTGVGICFPIITLISAFTYLYGNGGSPLCAMERGRGNTKEAEFYMGNSFTLLIATGIFLTILGLLIYRPVLFLFGASDVTFPYAEQYIRLYLLGTVFVMISVGMNPFINCQGFGNTGMFTILIGVILNIILNPLFIFVFHLGVRGAAIATIFSQFCSALWVVCNATLHIYGGDLYVGVMTVLNSVRDICTMPVQGFTNGASPVMSFCYGEDSFSKVRKAIGFMTAVCVSYTLLVWGILKIFPAFFIRIFNSDSSMISAGIPALHIYFFGFCFMALQFAGQSVFVSLGKSRYATFFSLLRKAFIVVPLTIFLPKITGLGTDGVFWAEPISNLLGGCACFITMLLTVLPELKHKETK